MFRGFGFSGQIVHRLLLREMHHDGPAYEIHFMIEPYDCRFGKEEFCLITGLKFGAIPLVEEYEPVDRGIHTRYFLDADRVDCEVVIAAIRGRNFERQFDCLKLCSLAMLNCFLKGPDERGEIPSWLLRLVEDYDAFNRFPWGTWLWVYSIQKFTTALHHAPHRTRGVDDVTDQPHVYSIAYSVYGLAYALLIHAFEAIPDLGGSVAERRKDRVRLGFQDLLKI